MIPTTFDKTLAPEGVHIMSLFTQWVPHEWADEPHTDELEAYADRMIDCYEEVAPGFRDSILHREVIGPHEMEQEYGLIGGNIFHGELSLEQLFHMRPAPGYADYRTPIKGLYHALVGHPRRRRRVRHPRVPGREGRPRRQEVRAQPVAPREVSDPSAVRAMLEARTVAVVGASARPGTFGAQLVAELAGR